MVCIICVHVSLTERIVMSLGKSLGIIAYALVMYMEVPTPSTTRRSRLAIMNPTAEGISSTNLHVVIWTSLGLKD